MFIQFLILDFGLDKDIFLYLNDEENVCFKVDQFESDLIVVLVEEEKKVVDDIIIDIFII